jgi:hypothetical protein
MNTISRLMTITLGSGLSILLSPNLAYPVDVDLTISEKSDGICISIVDLLSHQFTVQSLIDSSEISLIVETQINANHQQYVSIDRRGSERHR